MTDVLYDDDAERTVIGAALVDPGAFGNIQLVAGDFHSALHRQLYETMAWLGDHNQTIDPVTVRSRIRTLGSEPSGLALYLSDLMQGLPRQTNPEAWAKIVKNKSTLRKLHAASDIVRAVCSDAESPEAAVDAAMAAVLKVAEEAQGAGGFATPEAAAKSAMESIDRLMNTPDGIVGLRSGIASYDSETGGMKPHQMIILAARPAMGKSAAAVNIADHVASTGKRVAFFSMEMSRDELTTRRVAMRSGVPINSLAYNDAGLPKVTAIYGGLESDPLYIDETPALTVNQIRARSRRLAAEKGGLDLIVIDYIQLIRGERYENRQQEIAGIARSLKNLAKELNVPLIALSQLSRKVEERDNKRPVLSDLRESGELEQAADVVTFLYRPGMYDRTIDESEAEWITAKQRNGATFTVRLCYERELTTFYELGSEPWKNRKKGGKVDS